MAVAQAGVTVRGSHLPERLHRGGRPEAQRLLHGEQQVVVARRKAQRSALRRGGRRGGGWRSPSRALLRELGGGAKAGKIGRAGKVPRAGCTPRGGVKVLSNALGSGHSSEGLLSDHVQNCHLWASVWGALPRNPPQKTTSLLGSRKGHLKIVLYPECFFPTSNDTMLQGSVFPQINAFRDFNHFNHQLLKHWAQNVSKS